MAKKLVLSDVQIVFGDWLKRHTDCTVARIESGERSIGIVAFSCRSGCDDIYLQYTITSLDPEWRAQFEPLQDVDA